eukprot:CAMPEP_0196816360 /NCGR_PEP_ID=MMETSP1362-20130617/54907_1 /TAXON_ID=163516 /ORGANISM="Leptocylindrus danicus, Strain CCMP1856" /LENGTH=587 /DNA_ID=CAMNT_0042193657 /DNA_START=9 /DNA_END=1772 /DNA_ORIENTATION=+
MTDRKDKKRRRGKAKDDVDTENREETNVLDPLVTIALPTSQNVFPDITLDSSTDSLAAMVHPMPKNEFLMNVFRQKALHVSGAGLGRLRDLIEEGMFDLDTESILRETSSDNVFVWLKSGEHVRSIEVDDPSSAHALHLAGHATYCRAPPEVEQPLVASMLRGTGLGGGQYDPSGTRVTTLGRGEVEVFIGTDGHYTNWHTDFQENFTLQLSGVKRWRLKQGTVKHPIRGCTPHYASPETVECQLKAARLSNPDFQFGWPCEEMLNNSIGDVREVVMKPGDMLYFPAGMWHCVETLEPGVAINVSLMATNYASMVSSAIQHILLKEDRWREAVVDNSLDGGPNCAVAKLNNLLQELPEIINNVLVAANGTGAILPEVMRRPPVFATADQDMTGENTRSPEICAEGRPRADSEVSEENLDGVEDSEGENIDGVSDTASDTASATITESEVDEGNAIVSLEDFDMPTDFPVLSNNLSTVKLKRNPLASITSLEDVKKFYDPGSGSRKRFVMNFFYAGNEMLESSYRLVVEDAVTGELERICNDELSGKFGDTFKMRSHYSPKVLSFLVYHGYLLMSEDPRLKGTVHDIS